VLSFASPSALLRLQEVDRFLAQQDPGRPLLVVGPTWAVAEEAIRRQPRANFGWYRLSQQDLVRRLAAPECARRGWVPLTRLSAWACLQRALQVAAPPRYREISRFPGFSVVLQRTLQECRLAGTSPGEDLHATAEAYRDILQQEGLVDDADLLRIARESVATDGWLSQLRALVLIDLRWDDVCEAVAARISCALRVEPGDGADTGQLAPLRASLFQSARAAVELGAVEVTSANHQAAESVELARWMLQLAEAGLRWDEMGVFLRQPEVYVQTLQSALQRAGIPAHFTPGLRRPCPEGRAFIALLQCAVDGLSARCFNEYLSLGQLPKEVYRGAAEDDVQRSGRELPLPYRWQELIGAAAVVRGSSRWTQRLEGLAEQRRRQVTQLLREEPDSPKIQGYLQQIEQLQQLQDFALPVLLRLEGYAQPRSWGEWCDELSELARQTLATPDPVLQLLDELQPLRRLPDVSLRQVVSTLRPELVQLRRRSSGHRYGKVFVGTLEEAAGRTFRAVFVPGLAERRFPPPLREDPLLSQEQRRERGLPTLADQAEREKALLMSALGACEEKLVLSFPRRDSQYNRPLLPSLYLLEVLRATRGELLAPQQILDETYRPELPEPALAIDASEESLAWLQKSDPPPGSLRFLSDRNVHVGRALKSLAQQLAGQWHKADGCVGVQGTTDLAPCERSYSASNLQKFGECPYQFWLYSAYRLQPREEPEPLEELDALTRGSLLHEVHARLVWRGGGQGVSTAQLLEWLDEELKTVAEEWASRQLVLMPRVYQDEIDQLGREFAHWLQQHNRPEWPAIHAELAFELSDDLGRDPASSPQAAVLSERYRLRGSIDRVEQGPTGSLRVIDLKTGKASVPYGFQIKEGTVLQPALYALAAENALQKTVERSSLEFCTSRGGYQSRSPGNLKQAMAVALEALEQLDGAAHNGHFPAFPGDGACSRCNYKVVCGSRAEQRSDSKEPGAVTAAAQWWRSQR
jgi:ATP-dependent helicase/nuclease subunit B